MGTAYTPGLIVSGNTTISKLRRLPLRGEVLVREGALVTPDTIVARTLLPGIMQAVKLAERLGIEPGDVPAALQVAVGATVACGDLLAETKGLFGRYFRSQLRSPFAGTVELFSPVTGHLGIREAPSPVEKNAYISGTISQVLAGEGVVISCRGALVQGIFGVGGERLGEIALLSQADDMLTAETLTPQFAGKIVIGGSGVTLEGLRRAGEVGAVGIVCGGVVDVDLMTYLAGALNQPGYDIGVAITGQEPIPFTLILTEGFGTIRMAERTYRLFASLAGRVASIDGATQIRAGVIRPEVIIPLTEALAVSTAEPLADAGNELIPGTSIRIIREPYFGLLGTVSALPMELTQVDSGAMVRVLEANLTDGRRVLVPRANVEIIQSE